ncbi:MAG: T9SS type A sorting domain-containing protein [Gilvibacter sp.]
MKNLYLFSLLCLTVFAVKANDKNPVKGALSTTETVNMIDLGGGFEIPENALFAYAPFTGGVDNIGLYIYDPETDDLTYDPSYLGSTGGSTHHALDYNPADAGIYLLIDMGSGRSVATFDLETETVSVISTAVSTTGNTQPQSMAFGPDGTLYIAFQSGEINTYDLGSGDTTAFADVGGTAGSAGGVGLTFDVENGQLVHASGSGAAITLRGIDTSGTVSTLFTFAAATCGTAQAMEYVGNGKIIASTTFGCDTIYTIDLNTEAITVLANPTGYNGSIKDLMYVGDFTPFEITCQEAEIAIQPDFIATATAADVLVEDFPMNQLYALDPFASGVDNVFLLDYERDTDDIVWDDTYVQSTGAGGAFAFDFNPRDQTVYFMGSATGGGRALFTFDVETGDRVELGDIVSDGGSTNPQAMAFGSNGALYFVFNSGEINRYSLASGTMSPFATVETAGGGVGLTYDFDNDRLIHARGSTVATISEIPLSTGVPQALFSFVVPDDGCGGTAQAIEYVGNDKLIASTTFGCSSIYTVDLVTFVPNMILNPSFTDNIKSLMLIDYEVDITPNDFSCDDLGPHDVVVTVTDPFNRQASCETVVTVVDPDDNCILSTDEVTLDQFVMYPNPANDYFTLSWDPINRITAVEVYDFSGKRLINLPIDAFDSEQTIDVSSLSRGIYLVRVFNEDTMATKKLVIK